MTTPEPRVALPEGCRLHPLTTHADPRGGLTEVFRDQWLQSPPPQQWRAVHSAANVLHGVHVAARDWTYICLLNGAIFVGLHDLRPASTTTGRAAEIRISDSAKHALTIAPGVAFGVYIADQALYLTGVSDEGGAAAPSACRWNCSELGIAWPCDAPILDPADHGGVEYREFATRYRAATSGMTT